MPKKPMISLDAALLDDAEIVNPSGPDVTPKTTAEPELIDGGPADPVPDVVVDADEEDEVFVPPPIEPEEPEAPSKKRRRRKKTIDKPAEVVQNNGVGAHACIRSGRQGQ